MIRLTEQTQDPGINKMEIKTKLLVADGDIVVIGGIKKTIYLQINPLYLV